MCVSTIHAPSGAIHFLGGVALRRSVRLVPRRIRGFPSPLIREPPPLLAAGNPGTTPLPPPPPNVNWGFWKRAVEGVDPGRPVACPIRDGRGTGGLGVIEGWGPPKNVGVIGVPRREPESGGGSRSRLLFVVRLIRHRKTSHAGHPFERPAYLYSVRTSCGAFYIHLISGNV